jgi:hypothetical protein
LDSCRKRMTNHLRLATFNHPIWRVTKEVAVSLTSYQSGKL